MRMEAELSLPQLGRARRRHELRSLAYVRLDEANGGVIHDLTHDGIGVQSVAAVQGGQRLRVRFELAHPRLQVDAWGEVRWAGSEGQCGIRFLDLPPSTILRIDQWIFGNPLQGANPRSHQGAAIFPFSRPLTPAAAGGAEDDGLIVSPAPLKVIELPSRPTPSEPDRKHDLEVNRGAVSELDWLSQPLSGRGVAWAVNSLAVLAAVLLFVLVFLFVTREAPKWPFALAAGALIFVAAAYWGFFKLFGGSSPGARLARLAGYDFEDEEEAGNARFR